MVGATTRRTTKETHHTVHLHAHTLNTQTYTCIKTDARIQTSTYVRPRRRSMQNAVSKRTTRRAKRRASTALIVVPRTSEVSGALRDLQFDTVLCLEKRTGGRDDSDVALVNGERAGSRVSISEFRGNLQNLR